MCVFTFSLVCLAFLRILLSLSHSLSPSHGRLSSGATARRTCPSTASWQAGDSRSSGTPLSPSPSPAAASAAGTDCLTRPPSPVCQSLLMCESCDSFSLSTNPLSLNMCSLRRKFYICLQLDLAPAPPSRLLYSHLQRLLCLSYYSSLFSSQYLFLQFSRTLPN